MFVNNNGSNFFHIQNEMKNKTVAHLTLGGIISFVSHFKSHPYALIGGS